MSPSPKDAPAAGKEKELQSKRPSQEYADNVKTPCMSLTAYRLLTGQDFVLSIPDFGIIRVHTTLLSTKSTKLKAAFQVHQTGVDILRLLDPMKETVSGVEQQQEIRFILCAFITFCYCGSYDLDPVDEHITVLNTIERHYLAYKYSEFFEIAGLTEFTRKKFIANFHRFASVASPASLHRELNYWWQPKWDMSRPLNALVSDCSMAIFEKKMEEYKDKEEYKKVVELIEAVPKIAQEHYGRLARKGSAEVMVKLEDHSILNDDNE